MRSLLLHRGLKKTWSEGVFVGESISAVMNTKIMERSCSFQLSVEVISDFQLSLILRLRTLLLQPDSVAVCSRSKISHLARCLTVTSIRMLPFFSLATLTSPAAAGTVLAEVMW